MDKSQWKWCGNRGEASCSSGRLPSGSPPPHIYPRHCYPWINILDYCFMRNKIIITRFNEISLRWYKKVVSLLVFSPTFNIKLAFSLWKKIFKIKENRDPSIVLKIFRPYRAKYFPSKLIEREEIGFPSSLLYPIFFHVLISHTVVKNLSPI